MAQIHICLAGDEGAGKTSLALALLQDQDTFVASRVPTILPPITIPPNFESPSNVSSTIIDTSASLHERENLKRELRRANVICLVYSDPYSYERVSLFWLPYFRSVGVSVPVILCSNKSDLNEDVSTSQIMEEEMLPVMGEFREVDAGIRTSARRFTNVNELFFLCQKAVTHPIAPLFDIKEGKLKPSCETALRRIFWLNDVDQDGCLSNEEMQDFQYACFEKTLLESEITDIMTNLSRLDPHFVQERGISVEGFLALNRIFIEKGRHETLWIILRTYRYNDSLVLDETFRSPRFNVPGYASAELSPAAYRFLGNLFVLFDKNKNGVLRPAELRSLFNPTPGLPETWTDADFPYCTMHDEAGNVTLDGWLAQWSMTTFYTPEVTLAYLAYWGYVKLPSASADCTSALKITKPRKNRRTTPRVERSTVLCYVVGQGKSTIVNLFRSSARLAGKPKVKLYDPSIKPLTAVNSVEMSGSQCYLILEDLAQTEGAVLENQAKLDACDLICYVYDSSDPDSFQHVLDLRERHPSLSDVPALFVANKADLDRARQRTEIQPEEYTASLKIHPPYHVSTNWQSIHELFISIADTALRPSQALPRADGDEEDWTGIYAGVGASVCAAAFGILVWRLRAHE